MFRGIFISLGMIISKVTDFDLSNAGINMVDWISQTNYKDLQSQRQASGFEFQQGIVTSMGIINMLFRSPLPEFLMHGTIKLRLRGARVTIPVDKNI